MANKPLFPLGQVVATPAVLEHLKNTGMHPFILLARHQFGDWGIVPKEDAQANRDALKYGNRILSSYDVAGETVWIITEADRSSTTLLFPSEY